MYFHVFSYRNEAEGHPNMSRAKANWLRAFNKVRMQLQEVSLFFPQSKYLSTNYIEDNNCYIYWK